jgi:hypothetical protein
MNRGFTVIAAGYYMQKIVYVSLAFSKQRGATFLNIVRLRNWAYVVSKIIPSGTDSKRAYLSPQVCDAVCHSV